MTTVVAIVLSSCTSAPSSTRIGARDPSVPVGGTLRIAMGIPNQQQPGAPKEQVQAAAEAVLDPAKIEWDYTPVGYPVVELFRCCLLRTLYSYEGKPATEGGNALRPDLATGMPEVSRDGLTWTFHIKAGVHYAPPLQSEEIVAQDFIRAVERELTPQVGAFFEPPYLEVIQGAAEFLDGKAETISGLEARDPHTLIVHLTRPVGDLAARFSLPGTAPIPPNPSDPAAELGVAEGHDHGYGRFLVASGPYMFEGSSELDFSKPPDQQTPAFDLASGVLTLVRNPSWKPETDPLRPAYVNRIEISLGSSEPGQVVPVERPAYAAKVDSGELDFVLDTNSPSEQVLQYRSDPALADRVHQNPTNAVFPVSLSMSVPPLDDPHVRMAVMWAIDRAGMQQIIGDAGVPGAVATHVIPNSLEDGILSSYDPYPSPGHRGNLSAAKEQMKRSMYDGDHDGVCDRDCGPLFFPVPDSPFRQKTPEGCLKGALIQEDLSKVGIQVEYAGFSAFGPGANCPRPKQDALLQQPPAMGFGQPNADYLNAFTYLPCFWGESPLPPGETVGCNVLVSQTGASPKDLKAAGFPPAAVPTVDDRIDACLPLIGELQTRCWAELDQYLMEYVVPEFPWLAPQSFVVTSGRVVGFEFDQLTSLPALDQIALRSGGQS